jgi:hypothetical protein
MAKVNIAATKAVMPHVDPWEGIDWQGVEDALTSPAWQLADGRLISDLFSEGWPEIQRTVREQVRQWQRFDDELIGPQAGHIPIWRGSRERCALSPTAAVSRWLLLLLSAASGALFHPVDSIAAIPRVVAETVVQRED